MRGHISIKNQISKNIGYLSVESDEFIAYLEKFSDVAPHSPNRSHTPMYSLFIRLIVEGTFYEVNCCSIKLRIKRITFISASFIVVFATNFYGIFIPTSKE